MISCEPHIGPVQGIGYNSLRSRLPWEQVPGCSEQTVMESTINRLLTHCERWETLMNIIHDIGHFFDHINVATAVHRVAKLSKRQRVRRQTLLLGPHQDQRLSTNRQLHRQCTEWPGPSGLQRRSVHA